jgi:hypothetical protein
MLVRRLEVDGNPGKGVFFGSTGVNPDGTFVA